MIVVIKITYCRESLKILLFIDIKKLDEMNVEIIEQK